MFWGGERLKVELGELITDFDFKRVDHASYRLRVGPEIYVSPTGEPDDPRNKPKTLLTEGQGFTIPAGQFGFVLTEERVTVPKEAIAFISIRAGYKFRGLVNVSGFHVDPNYEGRLIFSVFNAGPGPVHLSRGEPCFLIWYADLDRPSDVEKKLGFDSIPSDLTGPIAGGLQSFAGLLSKINENDKKLDNRISVVEKEQAVLKWALALAVGALLTLGLRECSFSRPSVAPAATTAPASSSP
ncbi:deoxycytidine triphosphate deaminase [Mesorhizobium sp. M0955]|uniref:dCTP deaminase domain-containing protein n=1 Tax=unclassified Mesorhizobium TaxID=325217 RepID=UPI0033394011